MPLAPDVVQLISNYQDRLSLTPALLQSINRLLRNIQQAHPLNYIEHPSYTALLRLLKAHVTPIPGVQVSFAQLQAAKLQLLAEKLLAEGTNFPPQLQNAIRQGLVSGFDPETCTHIPQDRQNVILQQQRQREASNIETNRRHLANMRDEFHNTLNKCSEVCRAEETRGNDIHPNIPWEQRRLNTPLFKHTPQYRTLHQDLLQQERERIIKLRTTAVDEEITQILESHQNKKERLAPRQAALIETRQRHVRLLDLQTQIRKDIWKEHNDVIEASSRRGVRRPRTLKQLQREFERVDRARIRQKEIENRDIRKKTQSLMNAMADHINKFRSYHRDVVRRGVRATTKALLKYHEEVARNSNRAEREAEKARIQKLKDDDEEGYLELVRQTKNVRLKELLDQTDKYLTELGAVVKEERARSGVVEYNDVTAKTGVRHNYYETAHAIKEDVREQSSLLVGGTLKEYQVQGIQWMVSLYNNRLNGILADEMGLGKTIQTLGLIAHLMEKKDNPGPYLIIVPLSTISNWELEFARWTPAIRVVVFKGDAKTRKRLFEDIIEKKSFNVCLVTYEYVVRGKNFLKRVEWQHLIIDEGHRIKNHESRLSSVLHQYYRSRNRLLLTGTPLQNSLTELWALLNFLLPNVFKSAESFESWFAAPFAQMGVGNITATDESANLTEEESLLIIRRLHQVLRPFLLRRLKSDVLRMGEKLPDKQEHVILCEMSAWQRAMYVRIVKNEKILYTDRHGRQRYDRTPNPAVQLRKCVGHPYLFFPDHSSQLVDSSALWRSSGKFDMLDSMITKFLRTGHRVLVFNQMTKIVDLQVRLLTYRGIPFYRLDGGTSTDERKQMVNEFNSPDSEVNVFLLTTRAGGLGVNLQTADTVIIFETDWNPSMDQQAQDRAHRIGQQKEVLVLRMITAKTIEEDVMERASFKRGLEKKIIRAGMFDEQSKDCERQAMLRELLRVEGPVSEDDHEDGLPTQEEINRLLARSEEEFNIFMAIDEDRTQEIEPRPKLITEKEIPEWASKIPKALIEKAKISGAGDWASQKAIDLAVLSEPKRKRAAATNVSYGLDQLSERDYIKIMERSEAGEDVSLTDALRAVNKRKRRRKGGKTTPIDSSMASKHPSKSTSRDSLSDGGETSYQEKEASSSPSVAKKTTDMDSKSDEDDFTETGNITGGEQSGVQSGGDDLVIDDDDDDDDDDEVLIDGLEGNEDKNTDPVASPETAQAGSDDDVDSDSSSEKRGTMGPATKTTRGRAEFEESRKRRRSDLDKTFSGKQYGDSMKMKEPGIKRRTLSSKSSRFDKSETSDRKSLSGSKKTNDSRVHRKERRSSEEPRLPKRRENEKKEKRVSPVKDISDIDIPIPRIQKKKPSASSEKAPKNDNSKQKISLKSIPPPAKRSATTKKSSGDEEDGEIREDGELSDEGASEQKSNPTNASVEGNLPKLSDIPVPRRKSGQSSSDETQRDNGSRAASVHQRSTNTRDSGSEQDGGPASFGTGNQGSSAGFRQSDNSSQHGRRPGVRGQSTARTGPPNPSGNFSGSGQRPQIHPPLNTFNSNVSRPVAAVNNNFTMNARNGPPRQPPGFNKPNSRPAINGPPPGFGPNKLTPPIHPSPNFVGQNQNIRPQIHPPQGGYRNPNLGPPINGPPTNFSNVKRRPQIHPPTNFNNQSARGPGAPLQNGFGNVSMRPPMPGMMNTFTGPGMRPPPPGAPNQPPPPLPPGHRFPGGPSQPSSIQGSNQRFNNNSGRPPIPGRPLQGSPINRLPMSGPQMPGAPSPSSGGFRNQSMGSSQLHMPPVGFNGTPMSGSMASGSLGFSSNNNMRQLPNPPSNFVNKQNNVPPQGSSQSPAKLGEGPKSPNNPDVSDKPQEQEQPPNKKEVESKSSDPTPAKVLDGDLESGEDGEIEEDGEIVEDQ